MLHEHDHLVALVQQMLDLHQRHAAEGNPQMKTMLQRQIDTTDKQANSRSPTGWCMGCMG